MKYTLLLSIAVSTLLFSCSKKDGDKGPSDEDILHKKVEDIIPQKYLDTLQRLKLNINGGVTPPNVEGTYSVRPCILDTSNVDTDSPGTLFHPGIVHFSGQNNKDFSIKLIGEHFVSLSDTSIVTAISGSGNDFTVYGKIKSVNGSKSAIMALIITATKDGDNLRNFKIGIINIDNSNGAGVFIPEGKGRVAHDEDFVSEKITPKKIATENSREELSSTHHLGLINK